MKATPNDAVLPPDLRTDPNPTFGNLAQPKGYLVVNYHTKWYVFCSCIDKASYVPAIVLVQDKETYVVDGLKPETEEARKRAGARVWWYCWWRRAGAGGHIRALVAFFVSYAELSSPFGFVWFSVRRCKYMHKVDCVTCP